MKNLPAALIIEKNRLTSEGAWLILLDIALPQPPADPLIVRLVKNNEDITFQGHVYTAFPFDIEATQSDSAGQIPTVKLSISNVTRTLQGYIEGYHGGLGAAVTVTVVNSELLTEDYAELQMTFEVLESDSTSQFITFMLGAPNPLRKRFPLYVAIARHCNWRFKARECNYSGSDTTCKRTLDDCKSKGNSGRFGGRPGLSGNVRLA